MNWFGYTVKRSCKAFRLLWQCWYKKFVLMELWILCSSVYRDMSTCSKLCERWKLFFTYCKFNNFSSFGNGMSIWCSWVLSENKRCSTVSRLLVLSENCVAKSSDLDACMVEISRSIKKCNWKWGMSAFATLDDDGEQTTAQFSSRSLNFLWKLSVS